MLCFTLGFIFGIIVRHWLDLHEIPQKEPHDAVEHAYGADEVTWVEFTVAPNDTYQRMGLPTITYPRNGGESASD